MNEYRLQHIDGIEQLRVAATRWDDLWGRSEVTLPMARAEFLAQWVETFSQPAGFHALVAEDLQGSFVAALPMVDTRMAGTVRTATALSNHWSCGGDLLLDDSAEKDAALDVLLSGVADLPRDLLWLDGMAIDAPRWKKFASAADRAGLSTDFTEHYQVATIEIGDNWEACRQTWSKNHRKKMARYIRRLEERGELRLSLHRDLTPERLEPKLREAFELEDRGWKGAAGTSVLQTAGMFEFFHQQARLLAKQGELQLSFLELDSRPIAYSYAMAAGGVHHSLKISFDREFAAYSPGQVLRYFLLERFHADPTCRAMDCNGPLNVSQVPWKPTTYRTGRVAVAPRRLIGRTILHAYKHWWPQLSQLRSPSGLKVGAG